VFLSYASQDVEAARRICAALRAAGIVVWFDQSQLRGGDAWDQKIRREIHDCALFVPVISRHTQERLEGYFRREWKIAIDRTHDMAEQRPFLVPITIDDTNEREAIVPDAFRAVQWTRLPAGEAPADFAEHVQQLLSSRTATFLRPPPGADRATAPQHRGLARRAAWRIGVLAVAVAVVLLAAGYLTIDQLRISRPATAPPANATAFASPLRSIAVLPFLDLSEKHDQEYFSDGMAEELLDLLVKIPSLRVIARTSSFQFRGKGEDVRAIGEKLGVGFVVEGSVRRSGDDIRVTAQLIRSQDGSHLWSRTYERKLTDVLQVQSEIAHGIARALDLTIRDPDALSREPIANMQAYNIYLKGGHALDRNTQTSVEEAVADFQQALRLDPTFAPAALGLAGALFRQADYGYAPRTTFEESRAAAELASRLDQKMAEPHGGLAMFHLAYDWDWAAVEREIKLALALGPGRSGPIATAAIAAEVFGRLEEGIRYENEAIALDPLNPSYQTQLGAMLIGAGRFDEAEAAYRKVIELGNPERGRLGLANLDLIRGRPQAALAEFAPTNIAALAAVYHALGRHADSDRMLAQVIAEGGETNPGVIAWIYAARGERDATLAWLERAYRQKDADILGFQNNPMYKKTLGHDPRYQELVRKMNFPK
jgi:TolB-like protein